MWYITHHIIISNMRDIIKAISPISIKFKDEEADFIKIKLSRKKSTELWRKTSATRTIHIRITIEYSDSSFNAQPLILTEKYPDKPIEHEEAFNYMFRERSKYYINNDRIEGNEVEALLAVFASCLVTQNWTSLWRCSA